MKNLLYVLFIVSFVLLGCNSQTHFLSKEYRWSIFNKINNKYDKTGKIRTTSQISFEAINISIASDSTIWINPKTKKRHSIATSKIKEIEFRSNSVPYFIVGAGIGILGGTFLGLLIGGKEYSKKITLINPFKGNSDSGSGMKKGVIISATVGMGVGAIIGVGKTPKEKFILDYQKMMD